MNFKDLQGELQPTIKSQQRSKCHTVSEVKLLHKIIVILGCMYQRGHTQIKTNEDAAWLWFWGFSGLLLVGFSLVLFFSLRVIFELRPE